MIAYRQYNLFSRLYEALSLTISLTDCGQSDCGGSLKVPATLRLSARGPASFRRTTGQIARNQLDRHAECWVRRRHRNSRATLQYPCTHSKRGYHEHLAYLQGDQRLLPKKSRHKRSALAAYLCLEGLDLRLEIVVLLKLSL